MNIYKEFEKVSWRFNDKICLIYLPDNDKMMGITYSQVREKIDVYAKKLQAFGLKPGDRIAIACESRPAWNIAFMAGAKLGCTSALIDASLPGSEMISLIEKAEVKLCIASPKVHDSIGNISGVPTANILNDLKLFNGSCEKCQLERSEGNENYSVIIFSSGTTKTASGIVHNHDANILSTTMLLKTNGLGDEERYLGILPNSHIYGFYAQVLAPMLFGAQVGFVQSLNATGLTNAFSNFKPTIIPAVPKVYELLKSQVIKKIESKKVSKALYNFFFPICLRARKMWGIRLGKVIFKQIHDGFGGHVKVMCSAGSPMSEETCTFYFGAGFNILNTYGATETNIPTIGNYGYNITTNSTGRPYPDIRLKISQAGEILLKSPYFMEGYYNDEQSTKEAYTKDGWFKTGDLGEYNKDGNIVILGRSKENIVLATGKKAAPDDIEKAYQNINGVDELVICGVPVDDGSYDSVHAFIVADPINHNDIYEQLMARSSKLAAAMKLSGIHFVESIPKTSLQKPKRYLLQKLVLEDALENLSQVEESKKADSTDIAALVVLAVAKVGNVRPEDVKLHTKFLQEYTIDSLSTVELALEIEEFSGVKIDDAMDKDLTVAKLIALVQNPKMIKKKNISSIIYPLNKSAIDYKIYRFYRNLVHTIYKVKIKNDQVLPEDKGYIICANHVSNFDYLYLTQNFKRDRFNKFACMAKQELFKNKFINKMMVKVAGMVPVDRTGEVGDTMASIKEKLKDKWGVLIHPEGTRSKDGELGKFKNGAALLAIESKVPIVPAYINGGHEIYPPSQKLPKLFNWKKFKKYDVEVIYGDPIDPEGMTPETLTEKVRSAVEALGEKTKIKVKKKPAQKKKSPSIKRH